MPNAIETECEAIRQNSGTQADKAKEELREYHDRLQAHPEDFVSMGALAEEARRRIEARRQGVATAS
jgi:hypothetical protein